MFRYNQFVNQRFQIRGQMWGWCMCITRALLQGEIPWMETWPYGGSRVLRNIRSLYICKTHALHAVVTTVAEHIQGCKMSWGNVAALIRGTEHVVIDAEAISYAPSPSHSILCCSAVQCSAVKAEHRTQYLCMACTFPDSLHESGIRGILLCSTWGSNSFYFKPILRVIWVQLSRSLMYSLAYLGTPLAQNP